MRKLKIQLIDKDNRPIETVIAVRFEADEKATVISISENRTEKDVIRLIDSIGHWNIIEGMITIYYKSGGIIEITRLDD